MHAAVWWCHRAGARKRASGWASAYPQRAQQGWASTDDDAVSCPGGCTVNSCHPRDEELVGACRLRWRLPGCRPALGLSERLIHLYQLIRSPGHRALRQGSARDVGYAHPAAGGTQASSMWVGLVGPWPGPGTHRCSPATGVAVPAPLAGPPWACRKLGHTSRVWLLFACAKAKFWCMCSAQGHRAS